MSKINNEYSNFVNGYEITIEPLLFGDYYIGVYKDQSLVLDKKYYVNDWIAARLVAAKLELEYEDIAKEDN